MPSDRTAPAHPVFPDGRSEPGVLPTHWLWREDDARDGVTNMAIDDAMLSAVHEGVATWRWYQWTSPTVSFGRHEQVAGRFSPESLRDAGLEAVRRPTGGRALLHARELTYSVALPLAARWSWRVAYDAVNVVLVAALRAAGVAVDLAEGSGPVIPDGPVCFDRPAPGELTLNGRKLVGSAVWRQGEAYLQHGSILLRDDQQRLSHAMTAALAAPGAAGVPPIPAAAALGDAFPTSGDEEMRRVVYAATKATVERFAHVGPFVESSEWHERVASRHRHFSDPSWLWRR